MHLAELEFKLFFKLWYALIYGLNKKHKIIKKFKLPVFGEETDEEPIIAIRDALWENPQWIDEFLNDNNNGEFTESEREIFTSWRMGFVRGNFIIMKHYKKYSAFMRLDENPGKLYGVIGISAPIEQVLPYSLPLTVNTTLLPFNDKIIYDSFFSSNGISFGQGMMRDFFNKEFNKIKNNFGIIEKFNADGNATAVAPPEKPKPPKKPISVTKKKNGGPTNALLVKCNEIGRIIEKFFDERFHADFRDSFKKSGLYALQNLYAKRPSPLEKGNANTWACGIVYAICSNNFAFDKTQLYFTTAGEIAEWFGLSKSSAQNKSYEVNNILNISYLTPGYCIEDLSNDHQMRQLLNGEGFLADLLNMMREPPK